MVSHNLQVLTEKNFNKTVFASDAKTVVFFNDVEDDDPELDQYECFLQVYWSYSEEKSPDLVKTNNND